MTVTRRGTIHDADSSRGKPGGKRSGGPRGCGLEDEDRPPPKRLPVRLPPGDPVALVASAPDCRHDTLFCRGGDGFEAERLVDHGGPPAGDQAVADSPSKASRR